MWRRFSPQVVGHDKHGQPQGKDHSRLTPASSSISVGSTQQFTAAGYDRQGKIVSGATFLWSSGSQGIATIDSTSGLALGVAPGFTHIFAREPVSRQTGIRNIRCRARGAGPLHNPSRKRQRPAWPNYKIHSARARLAQSRGVHRRGNMVHLTYLRSFGGCLGERDGSIGRSRNSDSLRWRQISISTSDCTEHHD
jgi:Bacterial Ig-like domain (group 2)